MMNRIDIRDIRRALEHGPWFIEKITDGYILISHIDNEKEKYKVYANQLGILKDDDKVYRQVKMKPYSFLMLIK